MRKFILLIILMPLFTFSQTTDFVCGFVPDTDMYNISKYSGTVRSNFLDDEPIVFNVFYHVINPVDGINPSGINEEHILASIAQLNINFNPFNIFYKYRGFQENNDIITYQENGNTVTGPIYDATVPAIINHLDLDGNYGNMINVLILKHTLAGSGGSANRVSQYVEIPNLVFKDILLANNTVITHEFGHLAGLFHPFMGSASGDNTILNTICTADDTISPTNLRTRGNVSSLGENVTRVEFLADGSPNPKFNAKTKGDMVVDTPAQFKFASRNYCLDVITDIANYISHPNIVDNSGTSIIDPSVPYVDVDIRNFMNYGVLRVNHFTDGQIVRMKETILGDEFFSTRYEPRMNLSPDGSADLSVLYEPYAGEYFEIGPTLPIHRPLFQPGFDYLFVSCNGNYNTPSDYDDISFSYTNAILNKADKYFLELNKINHPNHSAIIIEQLESQPRKCYNNYNRSASNGTVIKFNDGVPNTNITVSQKNTTQINDTNLIQNLDNGLYTIQKNYNDGSQEQQTILKNDN